MIPLLEDLSPFPFMYPRSYLGPEGVSDGAGVVVVGVKREKEREEREKDRFLGTHTQAGTGCMDRWQGRYG